MKPFMIPLRRSFDPSSCTPVWSDPCLAVEDRLGGDEAGRAAQEAEVEDLGVGAWAVKEERGTLC